MSVPKQRQKAQILRLPASSVVRGWLGAGWRDYCANPLRSLLFGTSLFALGWGAVLGLYQLNLGWMILPAAAGAMMLGPLATVDLYRHSRRRAGLGGGGIAAPRQIFLVGVVMMVLALMWVRAATLLFAVFFGLRPFAGFPETLTTLLNTPQGIALLVVGSLVGGLFAALGFAISAFSFPMLVHRDIGGFSAMALSFNATLRNFRLTVLWGGTVTALIGVSLLTGLVGLILAFPLLGYATWHSYADLFESDTDAL
ncbi:MAG: DUF2189 domain-containing protein [Rhodobacteraceae bacterium]|nr:DUF2189 domain-containing protein [Paracoccaceae bacterium]